MAKRKIKPISNNDTKITAIVVGLFVALIILFLIFSKSKEIHKEAAPAPAEGVDMYLPTENVKPVEVLPAKTVRPVHVSNVPGSGGRIAIIIDDWGQSTINCRYLRDIPDPLAVSILPGLRHTKDVAKCAQQSHKLAMLHLPLEALHNYDFYPPNYIIKTSMKPELASRIVDEDLAQLPTIEGVNNHMGSKATENLPLMRLILKKIKKKGLFFVDSMTAPKTVCSKVAGELGVPFQRRDVFLDNINTKEAIVRQILILAQKARHRGYAVAIGHDRHLTMQVLKEEIPLLKKQGFKIVSIKDLLRKE